MFGALYLLAKEFYYDKNIKNAVMFFLLAGLFVIIIISNTDALTGSKTWNAVISIVFTVISIFIVDGINYLVVRY